MVRTSLRILRASVGLEATTPELLPRLPFPLEVKSLLSDFHRVEEIPFSGREDGLLRLEDAPMEEPVCVFAPESVRFRGPLGALEASASDLRYSLWGNQGFLYRYVLYLLERKHGIFSLHACGLWQAERNRLFVIAGGGGSGKTVFLLSGLERGLKLFSTETVHFTLQDTSLVWFMGSLVDNIRLGTLARDFPRFKPAEDLGAGSGLWRKKIAVDLSAHRAAEETLHDPETVVLFPRIESGWPEADRTRLSDPRQAAKLVFDNISQKISETVVLYDTLAVPGMDNPELATRRLTAAARLVGHATLRGVTEVISDPAHCWSGLLENA